MHRRLPLIGHEHVWLAWLGLLTTCGLAHMHPEPTALPCPTGCSLSTCCACIGSFAHAGPGAGDGPTPWINTAQPFLAQQPCVCVFPLPACRLGLEQKTVPLLLQKAGYRTGIIGK